MVNLKTISISESRFDAAYQLLAQSFPESEIRNNNEMKKLLNHPQYRLLGFVNSHQELCGVTGTWDLGLFLFIEHLAVAPGRRGEGIGSTMMCSFLETVRKPVILEVEDPVDGLKQRRIRFYERLGFIFNPLGYFQPMLQQSGVPVPLKLMSYPEKISLKQFPALKEKIFKTVYMF
ncbi:GNAT family N-acetyltransferase [Sporolactobacillus vineae]|uniref:GNAT family N-acetyltransferase n=1 Tax=Sporolactobacillus vineae TaxID=444463 RepID=UPI00028A27BD|nr:GNAT family N-acetyltransferase [Sporolactobacillus vineae]